MKFSPRLRPVPFILLAVLLLVMGARMTLAGMSAYQAEAFMTHWTTQTPAREPAPSAWQVADAAARQAVALYPVASGDYLDRLGRVQAWQHFQQPRGNATAAASRRAALAAYREAVQARPTWPDTQARLAQGKILLAEPDAEFEAALAAADRLGGGRWQVSEEIAAVTLAGWLWLDEAQRQRGERHALRLLELGPPGEQRLLALGQAYGLPQAVCAATPDKAAFVALCQ